MEIYRTLFKKEIISEFALPKKKSNKVLIICPGMPGSPSKKEVIEKFAKAGYLVFSPRYRGSWESKGKFLKKSPHLDIIDIIESLNKPIKDAWEGKTFNIKNPQIFIYGVSFGGPAALLVSKHPKVKKVIAMSPVVDWRVPSKEEPMDKLDKFVKAGFGRAYDYETKNWNKLARGEFYNPLTETEKIQGKKLWIIHAKDDGVVPFEPSVELAKKVKCKITLYPKGGHDLGRILLNKRRTFKKIIKHLS